MQGARAGTLEQLRTTIAHIEHARASTAAVLPFGLPELDSALPRGGLLAGALHEVSGNGAATAQFAAGVLARQQGTVLWVLEQQGDLFAPGLAGAGLHPDRVVYAEVGRGGPVLLAMEEGLRHAGLAGVVGELPGRLSLTASRRLQLAAESFGVMAIVLRDSQAFDGRDPSAALTRWRVSALPAGPPLPHAPFVPGVGRGTWRLELLQPGRQNRIMDGGGVR